MSSWQSLCRSSGAGHKPESDWEPHQLCLKDLSTCQLNHDYKPRAGQGHLLAADVSHPRLRQSCARPLPALSSGFYERCHQACGKRLLQKPLQGSLLAGLLLQSLDLQVSSVEHSQSAASGMSVHVVYLLVACRVEIFEWPVPNNCHSQRGPGFFSQQSWRLGNGCQRRVLPRQRQTHRRQPCPHPPGPQCSA